MHFSKRLDCTFCKIRAVTNFEVGKEMKTKKIVGDSTSSQSTRYYFPTWFIWQNTSIIVSTHRCTGIYSMMQIKAMFSDCCEVIPIGYGFNYGGARI